MNIQGNITAHYQRGLDLFSEGGAAAGHGLSLIAEAAHAGHPDAAHFVSLTVAVDRARPDNWEMALAYLCRAAKAGHILARETLVFLAGDLEGAASMGDQAFSDDAVRRLHDMVDIGAWRVAPPARLVRESPRISIIEGLASSQLCDWIIRRAEPKLERALVYHPQGGGAAGTGRTNSSMGFGYADRDMAILLLSDRIANLSGFFLEEFEPPSVLHYTEGQEFRPHYDYFDPGVPVYAAEMKAKGQRLVTLLLYLNDGYEGGETDFPVLEFRYKGRKGDAILFHNVSHSGVPDPRTLHAGLALTQGEKWLFSQWLRRKV